MNSSALLAKAAFAVVHVQNRGPLVFGTHPYRPLRRFRHFDAAAGNAAGCHSQNRSDSCAPKTFID
eukprot:scaffold11654_cov45-Prasinocladus_malaysianus.AAC.2